MDFNSLKEAASNLTLYDLKAGVRKVQNAVMNYTEMESKVREATNNEPWGASSSMMQEIANATFNYQLLNEVMPMIYKRFTEKSAEEWRQIYKALQLLEFLIKNGSERVIDDARSHLSLLKMLKQFHFIDQNGKDQGINVRNRSKELTELLGDVERIRAERKKARATKNKYGGVEGGAGMGMGVGGSSARYGGFGSESGGAGYEGSFGGTSRGVYGDGGGFGGESHEEYDEGGRTAGAERFDEYDEYDDGGAQAAPARRKAPTSTARSSAKKAETPKPKPKEPEVDLFDFGDDEPAVAAPSNGSASAALAPPTIAPQPVADDDDFDDFQSATPAPQPAAPAIPKPNYSSFSTTSSTTQFAQPTPQSGANQAGFSNIFSTTSPPPSSTGTPSISAFSPPPAQKPSGYQPSGPNYFTSVAAPSSASPAGTVSSPGAAIGGNKIGAPAAKKAAGGGDAFASLLAGSGMKKGGAAGQGKGLTIADMAKQKSQAGLYGAPASAAQSGSGSQSAKTGSAMDDLLG
jgi:epsin